MQQAKFNASAFKLSLIASAIAGMAFSSSSVLAQEQASNSAQMLKSGSDWLSTIF